MLTAIFEKFKEKKLNVVTALREAADATYLTVSVQQLNVAVRMCSAILYS